MIPGGNLLKAALTMIASQTVTFYADVGRTTSPNGSQVTAYAPGVEITIGSLQAVPLDRYEQMGLDFTRVYVSWFVPISAFGVRVGRSGDQFVYDGQRYDIVGETRWFRQDGWVSLIGVAQKGTP